jgi:hypothetical protein
MERFDTFDSWDAVLTFVRAGGRLYYQAPLDYRPVAVGASVRGNGRKVRVVPPTRDCDPFWADAGHLDRMRQPVGR